MKRVTLELGGKSPNIFFADADFEAAIDGALFGVFINQGEVCSAGSRILVQKPIYKKFVDAMAEKAKKIKLGPPLERETQRWALSSAKSNTIACAPISRSARRKPRVASGRRTAEQFAKGYLRAADDLLRRRQLALASPAKKFSARSRR